MTAPKYAQGTSTGNQPDPGGAVMPGRPNHMAGNSVIDRFMRGVGALAKWLCLVLVLLQFGIVIARYLFNMGSPIAQEALLYLFGTMFMLMLAETLQADRHVRVDSLYQNLSVRWRRWIDAFGLVAFLGVLSVFVLWSSWGYVAASWAVRESSRDPMGLPGVFLFKTMILVAFGLLIVQALAILVRCLLPAQDSARQGNR